MPKDLVERRFDTGILNRVWTSDITHPGTGEGWLYLCAVRDGCSRKVIGWASTDNLHTDLVQGALEMAVAMRGELAEQVVVHADRGCQYTSAQLAQFAREQSGPARLAVQGVLGQRPAGIILATLKVEFYDRYVWPTKATANSPSAIGSSASTIDAAPFIARGMIRPFFSRTDSLRHGTSRLTLCPPNGVKPKWQSTAFPRVVLPNIAGYRGSLR